MKLSGFIDFYLLEALQVSMKSDKEPFLHSHALLNRDVEETFESLSNNMAHMLADYLWLAAMGEARYAHGKATYFSPSLPYRSSRTAAYQDFRSYAPVETNIQTLETIFFDRWNTGGYGGKPWGLIARCARLYNNTSSVIFVDTVASIRHNGGLAFSKGEAAGVMDMQFDMGTNELSSLLETKMRAEDANYLFRNLSSRLFGYMSYKTRRLLDRFVVLGIDKKLGKTIGNSLVSAREYRESFSYESTLGYKPIVWGDKIMQPAEKVPGRRSFADDFAPCEYCGTKINKDGHPKYNGKLICKPCIEKLGLIHCEVCARYKSSNEKHVCGCGMLHCNECHKLCDACSGHCCGGCIYGCDECDFKGCRNCYRVKHGHQCDYCGDSICENSDKKCGRMTCGEYVCTDHYARHMDRCEECNPHICVSCGERTSYKCMECSKYCCSVCMIVCKGCRRYVCSSCASEKYANCSACGDKFCATCTDAMTRMNAMIVACGANLMCRKCVYLHRKSCDTCGKVELCSVKDCIYKAEQCKCGKSTNCQYHARYCSACNEIMCQSCAVQCKNCSTWTHNSCSKKSKCGAVHCSLKCARSHNTTCKAASQVCSCGKTWEHMPILEKCSKCGNNICAECVFFCTTCNELYCNKCASVEYGACGVAMCSKECAVKHDAQCPFTKQAIKEKKVIVATPEINIKDKIKSISINEVSEDWSSLITIDSVTNDNVVNKAVEPSITSNKSNTTIADYAMAIKQYRESKNV